MTYILEEMNHKIPQPNFSYYDRVKCPIQCIKLPQLSGIHLDLTFETVVLIWG